MNLRESDFEAIKNIYFYLFENGKVKTKGPIPKTVFNFIDEKPFKFDDFEITPIPVFLARNIYLSVINLEILLTYQMYPKFQKVQKSF